MNYLFQLKSASIAFLRRICRLHPFMNIENVTVTIKQIKAAVIGYYGGLAESMQMRTLF